MTRAASEFEEPKLAGPVLTRRQFLRVSAAAGGGLLVFAAIPWSSADPSRADAAQHRFGVFVAVDEEGNVIVTIPVPEIGQGVRTSLAMLVAEELDVPWERVRVVQGGSGADLGPNPRAAGSRAVRDYWTVLREAGATARAALVNAAATRWAVQPSSLRASDGVIHHVPSGRSVPFGDVAAEAAALPLPGDIRLKAPSEFKIIGTARNHIDTPAIVKGDAIFGADVRVPGMLRAVILRAPTYGGQLISVDDSDALASPGVRRVTTIASIGDAARPGVHSGVAVVAESTWAALRGRDRLRAEWAPGPNSEESTERLHRVGRAALDGRGELFREEGDVDAALAGAIRRTEAVYHAPLLAHAPMEPMSCVAHVVGDRCELWAPTQVPAAAVAQAASVLEIPRENVTVYVTRIGGGFGRRLDQDYVAEAALIARDADVPVQVVWTREDDFRHGWFRPFSYHRIEGGLDAGGNIIGWIHHQSGTSRYAFREGLHVGQPEFRMGTYPAALIPAMRLEYSLIESNVPRGPLRAPGYNSYTFPVESFVDELAHAADRDPLEFRLQLLAGDRQVSHDRDDPYFSTARMRGVLEAAAERAEWGRRVREGRGLGIACGFTFGSYCAHVVEAEVDPESGRVRVHRVFSAIDAGVAVNPNGIRAQVEGGVIDGLGAAMLGEITMEGGGVVQSNFHDFPLLRLPAAPAVEVVILEGADAPTGVGEAPYPPIFPALANAIFAASGARVRSMPFRPARVREALARRGEERSDPPA